MAKKHRVAHYGTRLERVIRHIHDHLDDDMDVPALAEVACFSPYHFHRIYRGFNGETVTDTIRRLRLHRAADDLLRGALPIAAVAARAGYGSVEAFTRSFRDSHGVTPAAYRASGRLQPVSATIHRGHSAMYDVKFMTVAPLTLAAMRHEGPYLEIGRTFDRLNAWAGVNGLIGPQARFFGVYYDDPCTVAAEALRSDACITVSADFKPDRGDIHLVEIPAGRCAVTRHQGPYAELEKVYGWLYQTWLPDSREEPADRPCFEEYLNNPRSLPPAEWLTDVYLPLRA